MPTLGYWDVRALCEPIRFLLHYKNVNFEDKRYQFGSDEWQKDKCNLELDFPNLPYYIDDDVKLTQSISILRYLAKKYDLDGKTEKDRLRMSMAEQQTVDMRWDLIRLIVFDNIEESKPEFIKNASLQLKLWESFLGERKYIAGDYITYVDFLVYETFDFYSLFESKLYKDFHIMRAYHSRIRNLPQLQNYFKSTTYKSWPIFGPKVKWGGSGPEPKLTCTKE